MFASAPHSAASTLSHVRAFEFVTPNTGPSLSRATTVTKPSTRLAWAVAARSAPRRRQVADTSKPVLRAGARSGLPTQSVPIRRSPK